MKVYLKKVIVFELANCTCIANTFNCDPFFLFKFNATIYGNVQKGELRKS